MVNKNTNQNEHKKGANMTTVETTRNEATVQTTSTLNSEENGMNAQKESYLNDLNQKTKESAMTTEETRSNAGEEINNSNAGEGTMSEEIKTEELLKEATVPSIVKSKKEYDGTTKPNLALGNIKSIKGLDKVRERAEKRLAYLLPRYNEIRLLIPEEIKTVKEANIKEKGSEILEELKGLKERLTEIEKSGAKLLSEMSNELLPEFTL